MTFHLGGSSFAQTQNKIGNRNFNITDSDYFKSFSINSRIDSENQISAGHDISSGGLITTLLEMCFPTLMLE